MPISSSDPNGVTHPPPADITQHQSPLRKNILRKKRERKRRLTRLQIRTSIHTLPISPLHPPRDTTRLHPTFTPLHPPPPVPPPIPHIGYGRAAPSWEQPAFAITFHVRCRADARRGRLVCGGRGAGRGRGRELVSLCTGKITGLADAACGHRVSGVVARFMSWRGEDL
jgi:hypothetical protein